MRRFPDCGENRDGWYPIRTWLGTKWIRLYESRMLNGSLLELDAEITTVFEVPLFDQPDTQTATGLKLSPQKLHATASLSYLPFHFSNTFSLQASSGIWYKVDTWMGAKWVLNPVILENVRGTPVSYLMKLTGKERVYPTPFAIPTQEEIIDPQAVQVTMEWNNRTGPATGNVWLKLELPQGERWVVPQNQIWPNYRELSESLTLPTEARSYAAPGESDPLELLGPGTYQAFEASGDWVHIRTGRKPETVWVNPSRALLERPLGIEKTDETIDLTAEDQTYRFPSTEVIAQPRGFYAPQTVRAFEKWISPEGDIWYRFHGYKLDVWVRRSQVPQ